MPSPLVFVYTPVWPAPLSLRDGERLVILNEGGNLSLSLEASDRSSVVSSHVLPSHLGALFLASVEPPQRIRNLLQMLKLAAESL